MHLDRLTLMAIVLGAMAAAAPLRAANAQEAPRAVAPPAERAGREAPVVTIVPIAPLVPLVPATPASAGQAQVRPQEAAAPSPAEALAAGRAAPTAKGQGARRTTPKRRAVEQVLTPTPRIMGSAAPGASAANAPLVYGPSLETRATAATAASAAAAAARPGYGPSLQPSNPAFCSGPDCFDGNGQRLGTGIGNTAVTPQGRLCTQGLAGLQCF